MSIGENIKESRKVKDLTQKQVGLDMGKDEITIDTLKKVMDKLFVENNKKPDEIKQLLLFLELTHEEVNTYFKSSANNNLEKVKDFLKTLANLKHNELVRKYTEFNKETTF